MVPGDDTALSSVKRRRLRKNKNNSPSCSPLLSSKLRVVSVIRYGMRTGCSGTGGAEETLVNKDYTSRRRGADGTGDGVYRGVIG